MAQQVFAPAYKRLWQEDRPISSFAKAQRKYIAQWPNPASPSVHLQITITTHPRHATASTAAMRPSERSPHSSKSTAERSLLRHSSAGEWRSTYIGSAMASLCGFCYVVV